MSVAVQQHVGRRCGSLRTRSFIRLRVLSSVDLPQPDGPMKAVISFSGIRDGDVLERVKGSVMQVQTLGFYFCCVHRAFFLSLFLPRQPLGGRRRERVERGDDDQQHDRRRIGLVGIAALRSKASTYAPKACVVELISESGICRDGARRVDERGGLAHDSADREDNPRRECRALAAGSTMRNTVRSLPAPSPKLPSR